MRKHLLAMVMTGTLATPAFAQATEPSFNGFRIEALAGYDMLRSGNEDQQDSEDESGSDSINGVTYGIGLGYDFDLGGIVAGIEGEISDSTGKQTEQETFDGIAIAAGFKVGRDLYAGGRIGFNAGPSTLIYAKGGYSNTRVDAFVEVDGERFKTKGNVDGFRLGAGVEQLFGRNAFGKLEYRYSSYSKLESGDDFNEDEDVRSDVDLDRHQVVVAFGFRF